MFFHKKSAEQSSISNLLKHLLESVEEVALRRSSGLHVLACAELLEGLFLFAREVLGDVDADLHDQVACAVAVTLYDRQSFAPQTHGLAGLSAWLYLYLDLSVDGRNFSRATQNGCRNIEQELVLQVLSVAKEFGVRLFLDVDLNVTGNTVPAGCIALAPLGHNHTFLNACRYLYLFNLLALHDACSSTVLTLVADDTACASASVTLCLSLHVSEHGVYGAISDARALTLRAGLCLSVFAAAAVTMGASDVFVYLELLGDAGSDLFQADANFEAKVRTLLNVLPASSSSAEASEASETTAKATTSEDVAKHAEDVVHRHAGAASETTLAIHSCKAELVVALALLGVVKDIICLSSLLELLLSLLVARIAVRVVLDGHLLVGGLYLGIRGCLADTKDFVVISLLCHNV